MTKRGRQKKSPKMNSPKMNSPKMMMSPRLSNLRKYQFSDKLQTFNEKVGDRIDLFLNVNTLLDIDGTYSLCAFFKCFVKSELSQNESPHMLQFSFFIRL